MFSSYSFLWCNLLLQLHQETTSGLCFWINCSTDTWQMLKKQPLSQVNLWLTGTLSDPPTQHLRFSGFSSTLFALGWGFRGRRIQRRHFRLDQIQAGGRKTSNGHISATRYPIDFVFGSRVGFLGTADPTAPFPVGKNSRWRPAAILENFKWPYYPIHCMYVRTPYFAVGL